LCLLLELSEGQNLFKLLKEKQVFEERDAKSIVLQIAKALDYLHSHSPPIIHRDLKPENVLYHNGCVKLIDFGWCNLSDDFRNTFCGTPEYLCPEMIQGLGHSEKLDIWTLGILTYELLVGQTPFAPKSGLDPRNAQMSIQDNILKGKIVFPPSVPEDAVEFIKNILITNPSRRPSASDLLSMDFLRNSGDNKINKNQKEKIESLNL